MIITGLLFLFLLIYLFLFYLNEQRPSKTLDNLILGAILCLSLLNIFNFNTDAEDTYIGLRYVKNLVDGNGLVFNTFDKVEGYSDFLWLLLVAVVHKLSNIEIPQSARLLGLFFSIVTLLYTYFLASKYTQSKHYGNVAGFFVALNGTYGCYGLSGLENPLFALFILMTFDFLLANRWYLLGIVISLATMTRPEGVILSVPVIVYLIFFVESWPNRFSFLTKTAVAAFLLFIPWTIWRYNYYGYLIPNTIAAKHGMDFWYQLKIGLKYTLRFSLDNGELIILTLFPSILMIRQAYHERSVKVLKEVKTVVLLTGALIFVAIYTYFGGDWMPGFRFYASIIPLLAILMVVLWHRFQLQSDRIIILGVLAFLGFSQIRNSMHSPYMLKAVNEWRTEVDGLKKIGRWFKESLPSETLVATFPNGAFSYYNELPTIDAGGLTDNTVGRFGYKKKVGGVPGHIAENWEYVLSRDPEIIAIMGGRGFENEINTTPIPGYENVTFTFKEYSNPNGKFVNLYIRQASKETILGYLSKYSDAQIEKQVK